MRVARLQTIDKSSFMFMIRYVIKLVRLAMLLFSLFGEGTFYFA